MTADRFTVASYNVHKAIGTDYRRDPDRVAQVIRDIDADIVALQEVDKRLGRRAGQLDLRHLERHCGLQALVPDRRKGRDALGWHGNLILVRGFTCVHLQTVALPGFEPRGAMIADLDRAGQGLRVISAHLGLLPMSRRQQAATLAAHCLPGRPTLFLGDTNEWTRAEGGPLSDLMQALGAQGVPLRASFPSRAPVLPLDRIVPGPGVRLRALRVHDTPLARRASDHLPLRADVWIEP